MTLLKASQLSKMRSKVSAMLPGTAVIHAEGGSVNSKGVFVSSFAPVSSGTVACRLDPINVASSDIAVLQGKETQTTYYRLTLPYDAPVNADNRVVIASNTYSVISLYEDHSWNVSKRAIVAKVE